MTPRISHPWPLRAAMLLFVLTAIAMSAPAGAWTPNGVPISVQSNSQEVDAAVLTSNGLTVFVWRDGRRADRDVYAQCVNAAGVTQWTAGGVAVCAAPGDQYTIVAVADTLGGVIIAWSDLRSGGASDVYAQRLDAAGAPSWTANGIEICTQAGNQDYPAIALHGGNGAVIAWEDYRTGRDIYAQRIDGAGALQWPAVGVAVCTATQIQFNVRVVANAGGGATISWDDLRNGVDNRDVYARRIATNGTPLGVANGAAICTAASLQGEPMLASDGAGGAIITWYDQRNGEFANDIYAQRLLSTNLVAWTADGIAVCTETGSQLSPRIVPDGTGGAVIAWHDSRAGGTIYAQRLNGTGVAQWTAQGALMASTSQASGLEICPDGTSGIIATWTGQSGSDVFAQRISGTSALPWGALASVLCTAADIQLRPVIAPATRVGEATVAWDDRRNEHDFTDVYAQGIGSANLIATETPGGWASPVVPRNTPGATFGNAPLTPVLDGNAGTTYFTWNIHQLAPFGIAVWEHRLILDFEQTLVTHTVAANADPDEVDSHINAGPYIIPGGRHTLTSIADAPGAIGEYSEFDNTWSGQWVWSPLLTSRAVPNVRAAPPHRGTSPEPNGDGFKFTRAVGHAWVASAAATNAASNCDVFVYDDYSGSQSGFSNRIGHSGQPGNATDFVIGHWSGTPVTVYPAVVRGIPGGTHTCAVDQTDAFDRRGDGTSSLWANQVLDANRLADVYEAQLDPGVIYDVTLVRTSGSADLRFEVFPATPGVIYARADAGSRGRSRPKTSSVDTLVYAGDVQGNYPVVVFRDNGTGVSSSVTYTLMWSARMNVDVGEVTPAALEFSGGVPNPTPGASHFRIALPTTGKVRLDLIDLAGRSIRRLVDREMTAGHHVIAWDGTRDNGERVSAGIYWARLRVGERMMVRRMTVLK